MQPHGQAVCPCEEYPAIHARSQGTELSVLSNHYPGTPSPGAGWCSAPLGPMGSLHCAFSCRVFILPSWALSLGPGLRLPIFNPGMWACG